jgi:DNA-directed RNA polymerase specialized sigma subunit
MRYTFQGIKVQKEDNEKYSDIILLLRKMICREDTAWEYFLKIWGGRIWHKIEKLLESYKGAKEYIQETIYYSIIINPFHNDKSLMDIVNILNSHERDKHNFIFWGYINITTLRRVSLYRRREKDTKEIDEGYEDPNTDENRGQRVFISELKKAMEKTLDHGESLVMHYYLIDGCDQTTIAKAIGKSNAWVAEKKRQAMLKILQWSLEKDRLFPPEMNAICPEGKDNKRFLKKVIGIMEEGFTYRQIQIMSLYLVGYEKSEIAHSLNVSGLEICEIIKELMAKVKKYCDSSENIG